MRTSKTKIFISRELEPNSVLNSLRDLLNVSLFTQSLIDFEAVPFTLNEPFDWIFFYSKNGVRYFDKGLLETFDISMKKIVCIGPKTAQLAEQLFGCKVQCIVDPNNSETIRSFKQKIGPQKVLFARALYSMKSIQKTLNPENVIDLVVYKNQAKAKISCPDCDILVFTSPLNFETYLSLRKITSKQKLIAIGPTTGKCIKHHTSMPVKIAQKPSEKALLNLITDYIHSDKNHI